MSEPAVKTRFAPSPTGLLHLGNIRTALFNALLARRLNGSFLLRIEDTDQSRVDQASLDAVLEDLRWLGLSWDEGPGCSGPAGGARQSERGAIYDRLFAELEAAGAAYPCFCTEEELTRARRAQRLAGRPPRYPGTCAALSREEARRRLAAGERATLRFRVPTSGEVRFEDLVRGPQRFATGDIGDFIIRRTDGSAAFFFGNAVDDALMGVSHVLRGEDHLTNTPRQLMILEALGLRAPAYGHIPMIVGADGAPLSKRNGSRPLAELREAGYLPAAILNYLARLGHVCESDALLDAAALASGFAVERLGRAPARYDESQLRHWQALAVAAAPEEELRGWLDGTGVPAAERDRFLAALRPNALFPEDFRLWAARLYGSRPEPDEDGRVLLREAGAGFFEAADRAYAERGDDVGGFLEALRSATGRRGRGLFMPLRIALTGVAHGPELGSIMKLLPARQVRERLRHARLLAEGAE